MSRRSQGEGSISESSNGRWVVRLELPRGPDGARRRMLRRARTKAEAVRKLRAMRAELEEHGAVGDGRRTFGEAVSDYSALLDRAERKRSTVTSHLWMLSLIDHGLGWKRLADLTVADCDRFLDDAAKGLRPGSKVISPDHLGRLRSMFVAVVDNEVRLGTVGRNVVTSAHRPRKPPKHRRQVRRRALTRGELAATFEVAVGVHVVVLDLIGRNGLRPAEARALKWDEIRLADRLLTIKTQMDEDDDPDEVKTRESSRTIRLDSVTVERLEEWRAVQEAMKSRHAERWSHNGLVVTTRYGTPINRNNLLRTVKRISVAVGIDPPIVPYELRHTAISHQADSGVSSWDIADWAGTSERMISETYRHQLRDISSLTPADDLGAAN